MSGSVRIHRFGESSNGDALLRSIDQKRRRKRRRRRFKNIILLSSSSIGAHRFLWFEFWPFSLDPRPLVRESLLNISFFLLLKKALSKETKRIPLKIESRTVVSTFARRLLVVSSRRRFVHFPFLCQLEHFRQHGDLVVGV